VGQVVRIAWVGLGPMGQGVHLRNFARLDGCRIVAVCDARRRLAEAVAKRYHIERWFTDYREMLAQVDCEAVVAIMGPPAHVPIALAAMQAGKHVYLEKPAATCLADAMELARVAAANRVHCQIGYMKRYDAGMRLARERIAQFDASGQFGPRLLGRVHYFCGDWTCGYRFDVVRTDEPAPPDPPAERYPAPDFLAGQGPLFHTWFQQFCHAINAVRYLWGEPQRVLHSHFVDWPEQPYHAVFQLEIDGVPVVIEAAPSWAHRWDEHYKLYYERGWVKVLATPPLLDQQPASVEVYSCQPPTRIERQHAGWGWAFVAEAEHFVKLVRGQAEPVTPIADAVRDLYLGEQLVRAWLESRAIELDYPTCA